MEPKQYDVVVVGAGPAGSLASYLLAERGYQVIILEKDYFPRYKPCGGGLTYRALSLIPFSIDEVIESTVTKFQFSHKFKHQFTKECTEPLVVCTMRDKFDQLMVDKAVEKGAEFMQGVKVTGFTETFDRVLVHTEDMEFSAGFVIGADGVNSITARCFQLTEGIKKGIGIESEVRVSPEQWERFSNMVCLDWGTFVEGYAWVFPKKGHLSIGVGGPVSLAKHLKSYYLLFMESLDVGEVELLSFRTFPIPYRTSFSRVQAARVLVAGDAAGLTDPMTGEGIYYALKSGSIAASVVMEFLEGTTNHPYNYRQRLEKEVVSELLAAFPLLRVFNAAPGIIHQQMKVRKRLWRGFCKVLRGQVSYLDFKEKMGNYKILWKPLIYISTMIETLRRVNYKASKLK
ncbi:MAG: NAD(P)/FAD-dependent oxidoreductase [Bacteroidales bacterium]